MPSGKTHERINEIATAVAMPATLILALRATGDLGRSLTITAYGLAGMLFATFFADPDLDHDHITLTEARLRQIPFVGLPLYVLFTAFWYPYARLSRHRGISHRPIIGTLLRLGYILIAFALINAVGRWILFGTPQNWTAPFLALFRWIVANPFEAGAWIAGVCLIDALHTLADFAWPHPVYRTARVSWRSLDRAAASRTWERY